MRWRWVRGFVTAVLAVGLVSAAPDVRAVAASETSRLTPELQAPRQARLAELFAELKRAPDKAAGEALAKKIVAVWRKTGDPDIDALMTQARLALQEGGIKEAYGALDRVIETAPNYAEGWNRRATLNYMVGRYAESVRDIHETLKREPRHFGALSGLGMIYMARKNWGAALKAFEKAAEVNPWLKDKDQLLSMLRKRAAGQQL
jgi:tetratricopeptide (TPR) repeat protein